MRPHVFRRMRRLALLPAAFLLAALFSVGRAVPVAAQPSALPTVQLTAGVHLITAEVAATDAARARGLMFRQTLLPNHGMLFVFDRKAAHCMWMRNTLIPLSVAFIDDDGTIVNIHDMQPHDERSHCARQPVRFALEMAQGWFEQKGVKPGTRIGRLPPARQ